MTGKKKKKKKKKGGGILSSQRKWNFSVNSLVEIRKNPSFAGLEGEGDRRSIYASQFFSLFKPSFDPGWV